MGALSGGQKRRVDVALGLIGDPDLVFLDEPTTGFDPAARRDAWNMIRGLRDLGKTVVLTTHYMEEAQHLADRLAILRDGLVVGSGTPDELIGATARGGTVIRFRLAGGVGPDAVQAAVGFAPEASGDEIVLRTDEAAAHAVPADELGASRTASSSRASRSRGRPSTTCSSSSPAKRARGAMKRRSMSDLALTDASDRRSTCAAECATPVQWCSRS